jgi:hypothetical protein
MRTLVELKALAEEFRAVADNKAEITRMANQVATDDPDDAQAIEFANRCKAASAKQNGAVAVTAVCESVRTRTA